MQIWTTPQLQERFLGNGLPVKLKTDADIMESYLRDAAQGDAAILPIDDGYMEFLARSMARGLRGPILFISPEPIIEHEGLRHANAVVLDLKRMGVAAVRNMVTCIVTLALERIPAEPKSFDRAPDGSGPVDEGPWEADIDIRETLSSLHKEGSRVIVAFQIREEEETVTVRGSCFIKALSDSALVMSGFKPLALLNGIRRERVVSLLFSRGDDRFHATLKSVSHSSDDLVASIPDRIFFVRRRFLRIEPSPPRPVYASLLLPNEPTALYKSLELSQRGFSFIGPGYFDQGKVYACTIMLPQPSSVLGSYGIIRSKKENDNGFRYGVELQIHPKDEDKIARYIMQRELQILSLLG